jgi:hypothetical protein
MARKLTPAASRLAAGSTEAVRSGDPPYRQAAQLTPRIRVGGAQPAGPAERKQSAVSTQPATRLGEVQAGGTGPGQQQWPGAVTEAGSDPYRAHKPGRVAPDPAAEAAGGGDGGDVVFRLC